MNPRVGDQDVERIFVRRISSSFSWIASSTARGPMGRRRVTFRIQRRVGVIPSLLSRLTLPPQPKSHFLPATAASGLLTFELLVFPRPVALAFVRLSSFATIRCDLSS
jgi:hypothetical protein